jgi:hypothetical protein
MRIKRMTFRLLVVLSAAMAVLFFGRGTKPALAADCANPVYEQPFLGFGDALQYVRVPGGSFEQDLAGWSVAGGAAIVPGNETFYVGSPSDSQSLYLPAGSSVTSPAVCAIHLAPTLRFFLKNSGSATGTLHVELIVGRNGVGNVLDAGNVSAGSSWTLSSLLRGDSPRRQAALVQVRLTPVGDQAAFTVDDLYVDPYKAF